MERVDAKTANVAILLHRKDKDEKRRNIRCWDGAVNVIKQRLQVVNNNNNREVTSYDEK